MSPFNLIEKLINEHGSSSILRDRLLLIKEELAKVEKERTDLLTKCSNLEKVNCDLRQQLNKQDVSKGFTEYMGALFKKDSSGSYMPLAHCPDCKRPLWNTRTGVFPYQCSTKDCGYTIMIHENLDLIAKKLNEESS